MERSLGPRLLIIVAIVGLMAFSAYPPGDKIKLGLDLRGGTHLVLQVETDDALQAETQKDIDYILQILEDNGAPGIDAERTGNTAFTLRKVPDAQDEKLDDNQYIDGWSFSRTGANLADLAFTMKPEHAKNLAELSVRQAIETIRNRVDAFGVSEPIVHRQGIAANRVVVQMPGVDDPERVKDLIKNVAFLELQLVQQGTTPAASEEELRQQLGGTVPNSVEILAQRLYDQDKNVIGRQFWALERKQVVTGRDLKDAQLSQDDFNQPAVSFILTREGGNKFGDVTAANIGRQLAIVLDDNVQSAPVIQDRIRDQGIIHGNYTIEEAQDLVTVLKSGALPAGLTYLEERTVGPTLGQDSIEQGQKAGLIGAIFVVFAMLLVYKLTGLNAVLALGLNIVVVFGFLALFDATLTLPGIAGIVLTVGMAVDANVLVFERIREELRAGRTVKSAIVAGFQKALSSILDANITTMIAAMFLFLFGTGPIRGFAVTLSVGIIASIFTAVFVSRFIFDAMYTRQQRVESISI